MNLLNEDNVKNLGHFDFIFDCIDDVKAKVALVKYSLLHPRDHHRAVTNCTLSLHDAYSKRE